MARNPHEATAQAGGKRGYSGGTHGAYGGGGGGNAPHLRRKTTFPKTNKTVTTGGASPFGYTRTPKGRTTTGGITGGNWKKHAEFSNYLKMMGLRDYHQLAGLDFKTNFPTLPNWAAKGLGYGYQGVTEGLRSLNPFGNNFGDFSGAFDTALEEGGLNALGIDQYTTGSPLETKYLETKKRYDTLAHGGLIDLYRYGGFI